MKDRVINVKRCELWEMWQSLIEAGVLIKTHVPEDIWEKLPADGNIVEGHRRVVEAGGKLEEILQHHFDTVVLGKKEE